MSDEIEFKFGVPAARLGALEAAVKRAGGRGQRLEAQYYDTASARLGRHGLSLRLRREGRQWLQTAKLATGDPLARAEDNVVLSVPAGTEPTLDVARHAGSAVAPALAKALGRAGAADLQPRFRTDVLRTACRVGRGGARIELALDVGTVVAGERSAPLREFELELKSGPVAPLLALAGRWADAHGLWLSTVSKAARGARLGGDGPAGAAVKAVAPDVGGDSASATRFVDACLASCLAQVLANASAVAEGDDDAEVVHQLRVGIRRLRTVLREMGDFGRDFDPAWEPSLRRAFRELGADRDRSVLLPQIDAKLAAEGAPALAPDAAKPRVRRPETVVRDARLQRTLLALIAFGRSDAAKLADADADADAGAHVAAAAAEASPRQLLEQRLDHLRRQLGRDGKRFAELEPALQHRARKRLKRLRYLGEFAAPLFGAKRAARYLAHWERAQDALGELNDCSVAEDLYRARARTDPNAWFAVGWLAARRSVLVDRCRKALRDAAAERPFWRS